MSQHVSAFVQRLQGSHHQFVAEKTWRTCNSNIRHKIGKTTTVKNFEVNEGVKFKVLGT